jgi:hypothetical protein
MNNGVMDNTEISKTLARVLRQIMYGLLRAYLSHVRSSYAIILTTTVVTWRGRIGVPN